MNNIELKSDDFISPATGVNISFYHLQSSVKDSSFNLRIGENISFVAFSGASVLHTHEFMEIIFVLSGEISHIINSEIQELTAGSIVFIRPNDIHCFNKKQNKESEIISVSFSLETFQNLGEYLGENSIFRNFSRAVIPELFQLSLRKLDKMAIELLKLNSLQFSNPNLVKVKFRVILADLFIKCFLTEQPLNAESKMPVWLDEICVKMRKISNLEQGFPRLKKIAPCSPEHLCKVFKNYLDKTPTEFINDLKIEHSANLLVNSDEEIYAIAVDLGFKSISRYYKLFKKQYGIPPAKYRKIMKKNSIPI